MMQTGPTQRAPQSSPGLHFVLGSGLLSQRCPEPSADEHRGLHVIVMREPETMAVVVLGRLVHF